MKTIYLAGGCFWSLQRYFGCVAGVEETQAGFANGSTRNPSYMEVMTDTAGFAQAVCVRYDESVLPLRGIVELYFMAVNPAGHKRARSVGAHSRLGIYYTDAADREAIERFADGQRKGRWSFPCVEIKPLESYYPAEAYHQHYLEKYPYGYCRIGREAFLYAGKYRAN